MARGLLRPARRSFLSWSAAFVFRDGLGAEVEHDVVDGALQTGGFALVGGQVGGAHRQLPVDGGVEGLVLLDEIQQGDELLQEEARGDSHLAAEVSRHAARERVDDLVRGFAREALWVLGRVEVPDVLADLDEAGVVEGL